MAFSATSQTRVLLPGIFTGILLGGGIAGALDILWAFLSTWLRTGYGPPVVLKAVASGLLGTHAFFRGTGTALLGLVLHFFIAFCWAALFAAIALRCGLLSRGTAVAGMLYGVVIYVVMNWVVLPLSAFPKPLLHHTAIEAALELLDHILLIGLPIALSLRYCLKGKVQRSAPGVPVTAVGAD